MMGHRPGNCFESDKYSIILKPEALTVSRFNIIIFHYNSRVNSYLTPEGDTV